jgi:ribonuclease BN (tRNA processing enzyme)
VRRLSLILLLIIAGLSSAVRASAPSLELLVLGSGGPGATGRAASSYLVLIDAVPRILVDAGPGSFARLGEANVPLAATDLVLLTHLHIDHVGELPGLFKARAVSGVGPIHFSVWGPAGSAGGADQAYFPSTREYLHLLFGPKGAFAYLNDFAAPVSIDAHDIAQSAALPQPIFKKEDLLITAVAGHHGDAPAVIYRIDHAGKSITFSGDIDAQGLPALLKIAKKTDLLVFNSVVLDPPGSPAILYSLHTPPHAIGQLARDDAVRALLLSHLSPATEKMSDAVSGSIRQSFAGSVSFAKDGMRVRP